jgi:hypothetical protein
MKSLDAITDPITMLKELVDNEQYLGYDPYYWDIRMALLRAAERIIAEHGGLSK